MKKFLAHWLASDPSASDVRQEQTTFSEVVKGEWRRPDVKCMYQGTPLVFEIQLSYTFLSDVIARDSFYKREGIFIIWVFSSFDRRRATVTDEAFFNRRNLFVLDTDAQNESVERSALTFNGYRQEPNLVDDHISDTWRTQYVGLRDTKFPADTLRPYFFDYDLARKAVESEQITAWQSQQRAEWLTSIRIYLDLALQYYESDYSVDLKNSILHQADQLRENWHWHRGFETLSSEYFFGWHAILPVLMSIKLNRPVGYKLKSVYQVIEVALRSGGRERPHSFAVLVLWAYKAWKPAVNEKNRRWLKDYAHKVKRSVDAGEDTYRRHEEYEEAIGALFPMLESDLCTTFGTGRSGGPSS